MPPTNNNDPAPWVNSQAKQILIQDILSGRVTGLKPKEVWESRPEYQQYKLENFRSNLKRLKTTIHLEHALALRDGLALQHDINVQPLAMNNPRGYPRWHASDAQRFLRDDIDAGLHEALTTQELWNS